MQLLVVTGLSGSGKSTALAALEDLGFFCVDNLPVPMLPDLPGLVDVDEGRRVAVCIDARDARYLPEFAAVHGRLRAAGHRVEILFLEAPVDVIVRRYSETRRKHPLGDLPQASEREVTLLAPLRRMASSIIDTRGMGARGLRQLIRDRYGVRGVMNLVLSSFGFKFGLLSSADVVFDVRFLNNPYNVPALRPLTGLEPSVSSFVLGQEDASTMLEHIEAVVRFVAPRSAREGRSYLTVAIGCTGGQHRSVALVEAMATRLETGRPLSEPAPNLIVRHRDLPEVAESGKGTPNASEPPRGAHADHP
ncbi:MAG: RNase adapter RapZ [Myxococcales bacterium]|nr:RNase adapter RapZ [Myxococcales bacterium]MCB9752506.1 RNase adapter RapZ [Myxococcales bacterium]